jgi:hypothetical protein
VKAELALFMIVPIPFIVKGSNEIIPILFRASDNKFIEAMVGHIVPLGYEKIVSGFWTCQVAFSSQMTYRVAFEPFPSHHRGFVPILT